MSHRRFLQTPALLAAATLLSAACTSLAPDPRPPAMPAPGHYGATPAPTATVAARGVAQRFDTGRAAMPEWWKQYGNAALDALIAEGLANSASLSATQHALAAAREQLRAAIGDSMFPAIDANASTGRIRAPALPFDSRGNPTGNTGQSAFYDNYAAQLRLSYTFDLFGASQLANAAEKSRVDVQAFQLDAARRTLATQIVVTAIQAAALATQVDDTTRLIALAERDAYEAQRRHALGAVSRDDMLAAQASAASVRASLPGLQRDALTTRHALAVLIGRTPDNAPAALPLASLLLPPDVPVSVPSTLLAQRPDIRAAAATVDAASAEVGVANAAMLPSLSINAAMGRGGFWQPALLSGSGAVWAALGSISMPIFHGGALRAQKRAAVATFEAARDQYRQTVLGAFRDVADALAALESDASTLAATDQSADANLARWTQRRAQLQLGAVAPAAERAAEQQYLRAKLDATRANANRLADTATLFNAMGVPEQEPEREREREREPEPEPEPHAAQGAIRPEMKSDAPAEAR